ncbi:MAG: DUF4294 domain-containing protein [Bacteroidales bacterium]|nr:DUF4294 domain-containing protein [Bacteroidales bacterium]
MMKFNQYLLFFFLLLPALSYGQSQHVLVPEMPRQGQVVKARIIDGDTIPVIDLKPVAFFAPRIFKNRADENRYRRLVQNVKRVYPYARLAGIKFDEYNEILMTLPTEAQRKRAMRQAENELRAQFEDDLKRLTFSQGLILIKLVDRQTKHTSYDVVREFRGMVSAVFWQGLGRIFGYNLKTEYDPEGEDRLIEEIVQMIEAGVL